MVLFVDLEDDDSTEYSNLNHDHAIQTARLQKLRLEEPALEEKRTQTSGDATPEEHLTYNGFSAVLSCYPFALGLAGHLDLNDLYALSLTSKAIHKPLLQFRNNLVTRSLRCSNDGNPLLIDLISNNGLLISDVIRTTENARYGSVPVVLNALSASILASTSRQAAQPQNQNIGKLRHCARDLVAACRKCGTVVCRNCAAKPPSDSCLKNRFRRLCASCLAAPLEAHLVSSSSYNPEKDPDHQQHALSSSASSTHSTRSTTSAESSSSISMTTSSPSPSIPPTPFTHTAFQHTPCACPTRGTYLCAPCGSNLIANDTTYKRVWTWRSRYSTHIGGGLGTGLGEGDQGQKCGRGAGCLEAGKEGKGMCWVEIDCSEGTVEGSVDESAGEEAAGVGGGGSANASTDALLHSTHHHHEHSHAPLVSIIGSDTTPINSRPSTPASASQRADHHHSAGPGYLRQEVEGLGGVMKKKVRKRVKVGATVWEHDDERESGKYLEREASGLQRSWCAWCGRVVLGRGDREEREKGVELS